MNRYKFWSVPKKAKIWIGKTFKDKALPAWQAQEKQQSVSVCGQPTLRFETGEKILFFFSRWSRVRAHLLSPPLNFVTCLSLLFTILRRRGISTMQKESLKKQSRAYFQDEEFLRNINLSTNHQLTTLLNT